MMERETDNASSASLITASAIMPALPEESSPELSSKDRLILFLASAAQAGGRLSPEAWKRASDAFEFVFGFVSSEENREKQHEFSLLQMRFHAALLREPLASVQFSTDQKLLGELTSLTPEKAESYIEAICELSPEYAELLKRVLSEDSERKTLLRERWKKSLSHLPGVGAWKEFFGEENAADARSVIMDNGVAVPRERQCTFPFKRWKRQRERLSSFFFEVGTLWDGMTEGVSQKALSHYRGATKYLQEVQLQRLFSLLLLKDRQSPVARRFLAVDEQAEVLRQTALECGALQTASAVQELRALMEEKSFTVVIVGEGKRGKSSLVNALLGKSLSPVREAVPETATVARFHWGEAFSGEVSFLSEEDCEHLEALLEEDNVALESARSFKRMAKARPPQKPVVLRSEDRVKAFLSMEEAGSQFASYVDIALPAPFLEKGLILVDTPGLNATDPVQNYLSYEECLSADCLVFVMDARRPESSSEQELLRQLAASGRATSIIGVVTGADRLNEKESRREAMGRASMLMDVVAESGMKTLGLLEINAREAMEQRCGVPKRSGGAAFRKFCSLIERAAVDRNLSDERRARIREKGQLLIQVARNDAQALLCREAAQLPDPRHEELLRRHCDRLAGVLHSCSDQAWAVVNAAVIDMESWRREQERALDAWQEKTVLRVMDAANRHADSLGFSAMFRAKNWKAFDDEVVPLIARECLEELLAERREVQRDWNEKLHQFGQRLEELSLLCLDAVTAQNDLQDISGVPFSQERWFFQANSVMKKLGLVAAGVMIRRGAGVGVGIVLGNMGWWAVIPAVLAGSVIWTLMRLGNPSRCRRIFLERKAFAVKNWVKAQRVRLDKVLGENLEELTLAYGKAVNDGFLPAMSVLGEEVAALRAYLDILRKIREGSQKESDHLIEKINILEKTLRDLEMV